jgi:hypothetical protein
VSHVVFVFYQRTLGPLAAAVGSENQDIQCDNLL